MNNKKLSARQTVLLTVTTVFSPAVRLFSSFSSEKQDQSVWLAIPLCAILTLMLARILSVLLSKGQSIDRILKNSFGNVIGAAAIIIYIVWGIIISSAQMRYYAIRVSSTVYSDISIEIFVYIMAAICVFALKKGITVLGRVNEIAIAIIVIVSVLLLGLLTPGIDAAGLLPQADSKGILHCAFFILASYGYLSLSLFYGDKIIDNKAFKIHSFWSTVLGSILLLWMFVAILGNLGPYILSKLPYPFFAVVRQITVGEFLQHIEAFVVALWIISDFINISFISSSIISLLSSSVKADESQLIIPYFALCIMLVPLLSKTSSALEMLTEYVFVPLNVILLYAVPFLCFFTQKIRAIRNKREQHQKSHFSL